MELHQN